MGILNFFGGGKKPKKVERIPAGSFTVGPHGNILATTLPRSFAEDHAADIGRRFVKLFQEAEEKKLPLTELHVEYAGLKIRARTLRGGAIIFLSPKTFSQRRN